MITFVLLEHILTSFRPNKLQINPLASWRNAVAMWETCDSLQYIAQIQCDKNLKLLHMKTLVFLEDI